MTTETRPDPVIDAETVEPEETELSWRERAEAAEALLELRTAELTAAQASLTEAQSLQASSLETIAALEASLETAETALEALTEEAEETSTVEAGDGHERTEEAPVISPAPPVPGPPNEERRESHPEEHADPAPRTRRPLIV